MNSPASTSSLAQPGPINRIRREHPPEPGIRLIFPSVKPKRASSEQIRKSQDIASSRPPQAQIPCAAQITGISIRSSLSKKSWIQRYSMRNLSVGKSCSNHETSAPAPNAFSPSALTIMHRISSFASIRRSIQRKSSFIPSSKVFRRSGRLSVIVKIRSEILTFKALNL